MSGAYEISDEVKPFIKFVRHNYKHSHHVRAAPFFKFLQSRISSIECNGLKELREYRESLPDDEKPIFVHMGRHLSEIDWSEAQLLFYLHNMPTVVSMGHNLDVGPVGNLLKALGGFVALREPCTLGDKKVSKTMANTIYNQYTHHVILNEGYDVLLYPEQIKVNIDGAMKRKYGRSYSGEILEFASHLFRLFQGIQKKTERPVMIVPHSVSRERVIEDQIFQTLTGMKEKGYSKEMIFAFDMGFVYTHWLYQKKGKVVINFGEPIPVESGGTKKLAEYVRSEVARMSVLFPTHILAYSLDGREGMQVEELEKGIEATIRSMDEIGFEVDCRNTGRTIERAFQQFNQPRRRIVQFSNGCFRVLRPDVIAQYRNNVVSLERLLKNHKCRARRVRRPKSHRHPKRCVPALSAVSGR